MTEAERLHALMRAARAIRGLDLPEAHREWLLRALADIGDLMEELR